MKRPKDKVNRSAALVYRHARSGVEFLFVSTRRDRRRLVLPAGHLEKNESAEQTAIRETKEEAGAEIKLERYLGRFVHKKHSGKRVPSDVYLASLLWQGKTKECREVVWLRPDEIETSPFRIRRRLAKFVNLACRRLSVQIAA